MPKRWDGFTPTDVDEFDALTERAFLNPFNPTGPDAVTETFVVPASCKWSLQNIPCGNVTSSASLAIYQGTDNNGTLLTCTTTTASLTANQVRVQQRTGFLEFFSGLAGETVYVEYTSRVSNIDAAYLAQLHAAVMRSGEDTGKVYTTGEDVVAGPGYISGGILFQADPSIAAKCGPVYITAACASGNTVNTLTTGTVTPRRTPPDGPVYCGHGGNITWDDDAEVLAMLDSATDYQHCIGWYYDGALHLNTLQDVRRIAS
jgi:hypothetical protein